MKELPLVPEPRLREYGAGDSWSSRLRALYREQQESWPLLRQGTAELGALRKKVLEVNGSRVTVQFNPRRIVNSAANIYPAAIAARPCFLCLPALPPEQRGLMLNGYLALCNPRPIFREHFTLLSPQHVPQLLEGREADFVEVVRQLGPEYALIFNGAKAGASAPDHLHFQICPAQDLPLLSALDAGKDARHVPWCGAVFEVLRGSEAAAVAKNLHAPGEQINVIGHYGGEFRIVVIRRAAHRPSCYFAEEPQKLLVSPAAVEMGGVFVTARECDFDRLDAELLRTIFAEVVEN